MNDFCNFNNDWSRFIFYSAAMQCYFTFYYLISVPENFNISMVSKNLNQWPNQIIEPCVRYEQNQITEVSTQGNLTTLYAQW